MGMLAALDYHHSLLEGQAPNHSEVEYRLRSWGELFPPFLGDREHSTAARFILSDFPFRLFSSSTPYDDPLPQELTLTFRAPHEVKYDSDGLHIAGIYPHETANEFAAFISVLTRRRVFASHQTRYDGLPMLQDAHLYANAQTQERQTLKEFDPREVYSLLESLRLLDRAIAEGFVLALRLYHTAVHLMFSEPEFSYLLLVTAIEAASSVALEAYRPPEDEYLDSRFPGWRHFETSIVPEDRPGFRACLMRGEHFTFRKLLRFLQLYVPNSFWDASVDDAKPEYLVGIVGPGPDGKGTYSLSRSDKTIADYERFGPDDLPGVLRRIYDARSALVHSGVRLPPSIVIGHYRMVPSIAAEELFRSALDADASPHLSIPPLLTFERITSSALVNFLRASGGESGS